MSYLPFICTYRKLSLFNLNLYDIDDITTSYDISGHHHLMRELSSKVIYFIIVDVNINNFIYDILLMISFLLIIIVTRAFTFVNSNSVN